MWSTLQPSSVRSTALSIYLNSRLFLLSVQFCSFQARSDCASLQQYAPYCKTHPFTAPGILLMLGISVQFSLIQCEFGLCLRVFWCKMLLGSKRLIQICGAVAHPRHSGAFKATRASAWTACRDSNLAFWFISCARIQYCLNWITFLAWQETGLLLRKSFWNSIKRTLRCKIPPLRLKSVTVPTMPPSPMERGTSSNAGTEAKNVSLMLDSDTITLARLWSVTELLVSIHENTDNKWRSCSPLCWLCTKRNMLALAARAGPTWRAMAI